MGRIFDELFADQVFYYKDKEIPVKSLGLGSDSLMHFCSHVSKNIYKWHLDGITYARIRAIHGVSDKKARAIAKALVRQGVEINDIPEIAEPTRLVVVGSAAAECTNCNSILTTNMDIAQQLYRYCPMCGKKLTW